MDEFNRVCDFLWKMFLWWLAITIIKDATTVLDALSKIGQ